MDYIQNNPLTGEALKVPGLAGANSIVYYDSDERAGPFAITAACLKQGFVWGQELTLRDEGERTRRYKLSPRDTQRLLALAYSKVHFAKLNNERTPLFVQDSWFRTFSQPQHRFQFFFEDHQILIIEALWEEARSLTLEAKALKTLEGFSQLEDSTGSGLMLSFNPEPYPGHLLAPSSGSLDLKGISYGCVPTEIPIAMQFLLDEALVCRTRAHGNAIYITPRGYSAIEKIRRDQYPVDASAFLICRFNGNLDAIYDRVYSQFGKGNLPGCEILRVKDRPHIDRVDDRILADIRRAALVVVDLTDYNFNIGFEAGYALALNKPIVWTKQHLEPTVGLDLPFDIQSHNILTYNPASPESFISELYPRIQVALEQAGKGH